MSKTSFTSFRKTLARMVEIGASNDLPSRGYDFLITGVILVNLAAVVLDTYVPRVRLAAGTTSFVSSPRSSPIPAKASHAPSPPTSSPSAASSIS